MCLASLARFCSASILLSGLAATSTSIGIADEFGSQYGLSNVGSDIAFERGFLGKDSKVAVFDTAVDLTHPEFSGRIGGSFDIYTGLPNAGFDGFHGTHVAGTIAANLDGTGMAGVAPMSMLFPVTVLRTSPASPGGGISLFDINALVPRGFDYAIAQSVDVINHSWGVSVAVTEPGTKAAMDAFFGDFVAAARRTVDAGIVNVWSTGNDSWSQSSVFGGLPYLYPDLQASWIAVTALNRDGTIASYANQCGVSAQWCIAAPGTDIYATFPVALTPYFAISGTSMAAPHVSGAVAIARELFPNATGAELTQLVLQTATDIGAAGIDPVFGWGALNVGNIVNVANPSTAGLYPTAAWSRFSTLDRVLAALPGARNGAATTAETSSLTALGYGPADDSQTPAPFRTEPDFDSTRVWMNTVYGHSTIAPGGASAGATSEAAGFVAGADFVIDDNWLFGFGGGLTWTEMRGRNTADIVETAGVHALAYANWRDRGRFFEAAGQIAYFDETFSRSSIAGDGGTVAAVGQGRASATAGALHLKAGHAFRASGIDIEPYLAGSARWQKWDGLTESGAGVFSLTLQSATSQQYEAGLGIRSHSPEFLVGTATEARISLDLSYAHLMGDRTLRATANLLGNTIDASTAELGAHIFRAGANLSVKLGGSRAVAVLSYDGQFQKNARSHGASLGVKVRF
jgi:subtilase-type serine protease